ncbi:MAG: GNAT family N-acetyltransferase [Bacteriovorax sp.]|nr:GNAT family N-acetyltransferase [Bacteriovorax sp.]
MDTSKFIIREIQPGDKESLQEGLAQMTNESRRLRFFYSRKNFTEKELKFLTEVDQHNHIAFVCISNENSPAGSIRCVRNFDRPEFAELAVTIVDKYQGQGLGYRLLDTLADAAIKENITHLYGDFHTSNTNMLKLLEKYCLRHNITMDSLSLNHTSDGFLYFEMPLR